MNYINKDKLQEEIRVGGKKLNKKWKFHTVGDIRFITDTKSQTTLAAVTETFVFWTQSKGHRSVIQTKKILWKHATVIP